MSAPAALLADLDSALHSEFGARTIYALLARRERDVELARLLATLAEEQTPQIVLLSGLIESLGGRARRHCRRRVLLARALYLARLLGARQLALRLCHDGQETLAHGYHWCAQYLAASGADEAALLCGELARAKDLQARALSTWLEHGAHPAGLPPRR